MAHKRFCVGRSSHQAGKLERMVHYDEGCWQIRAKVGGEAWTVCLIEPQEPSAQSAPLSEAASAVRAR